MTGTNFDCSFFVLLLDCVAFNIIVSNLYKKLVTLPISKVSLKILPWLKNNQPDFNNKKLVSLTMSKVSLKISLRFKNNKSECSKN